MTYCQTMTRIAASLARRKGWAVLVSDSRSTESSYLYIGHPSRFGGFTTVGVLRVSNHRIPGYARGGWHKGRYDLRPRSRKADRARIDRFLSHFEAHHD
jgi:hypothetical protein